MPAFAIAVPAKLARMLVVFGLVFLATASAPDYRTPSSWTNYQATDANNAVFPGTLAASWSFDTGGKINGSLAVVGHTVYVDSFSKSVFAIDLTNGHQLWRASVPNIVMSTPIVTNGLVIVGTGTNAVIEDQGDTTIWGRKEGDDIIALRQSNGSVAWKFHTVGEDMPTPAVVNGVLVFSNGDMHAYGLEPATGKLLWTTPIPGITTMSATASLGGHAFVIATRGVDYFLRPKDETHVLSLDVKTGHVVWSAPYGNSDCSPTVYEHLVMCEGSTFSNYGPSGFGWMGANDVDAYDVATGALKWRWISGNGYFTSVASNERGIAGMVHNGVLYQAVPATDEVVAINADTGRLIWSVKTAGPVKMSPVLAYGKLFFGDTSGLLYCIDAKNGSVNNLASYKAPFSTSSPIVVGKTLLIANGKSLLAIPLSSIVL